MFGTDGIRGFPYKGLFIKKNLIKIGYSYAIFLKREYPEISNIFFAKDTRESSNFIQKNLITGVNQAGLNSIELGILPTSSLSIFTRKYPNSAGIMITASHNSSEYNGIKFINIYGEKISNTDENKISKIFNLKKKTYSTKVSNIVYKNALSEYTNEIVNNFKESKFPKYRFCVDVSNGASYVATNKILNMFNLDFTIISKKPNGTNINKRCGVEYNQKIKNYVIKNKLDFGVSIDGDADRIIFINNTGNIIHGDKILTFIAENTLKKGEALVTTTMSNNIIEKRLKQKGIKTIRTDVGDKNVYQMMKKVNSSFGGENSGHYIIKSLLNTSDSNLTLLYLLSIIKEKKISFDDIARIKMNPSKLNSYNINKKIPIHLIPRMNTFVNMFKKNHGEKGYLNIRYSGTENKIRILIQGLNEKKEKDEMSKFEEVIKVLN